MRFTGLRPGEKLTEKIFSDSEIRMPTAHPKIWATRSSETPPGFPALLQELYQVAATNDAPAVRALLEQMLPEYQPTRHPPTPAAVGAPYPDGF
jgi:FlaA1/EpsC-like NDP-sugar epimerase